MSEVHTSRVVACEFPGCDRPMTMRAYASHNADHGENVHPLHARYPAAMIRACQDHIGVLLLCDTAAPLSTRQWLIVAPLLDVDELGFPMTPPPLLDDDAYRAARARR